MSQYRARLQSINMGIRSRATTGSFATGNTLEATPTGSTDDTVLRFVAANTAIGGRGVSVADSAANATIVTLSQPGIYHCLLSLTTVEQVGATTALMAITRDSTITTANPTYAGGALEIQSAVMSLSAGVNQFTHQLSAFTTLTKGQTALIRFQCSDGSNGAPTNLSVATASFQIFKVSARG